MQIWMVLGFLAGGKTTFLTQFLPQLADKNTAVLVNEFGSKDVDGALLRPLTKHYSSVVSGSIFCSCRSDQFIDALVKLRDQGLQTVVVECSGLANPSALADTLSLFPSYTKEKLCIRGCIGLVDAQNFERQVTTAHMCKLQVAASDLLVLNKCDLVTKSDIDRVQSLLRIWNQNAPIVCTSYGRVDKSILDNIKPISHHLPPVIQDLRVQRCLVRVPKEATESQLNEFCAKASVFTHRIKGITNARGKVEVMEYENGHMSYFASDEQGSFVVLLAVIPQNLKTLVEEILPKGFEIG